MLNRGLRQPLCDGTEHLVNRAHLLYSTGVTVTDAARWSTTGKQ